MKFVNLFVAIGSAIVLSGCLCIGCFVPQLPAPPKPQIEDWKRSATTVESRLADWQACGGDKSGNFSRNPKDTAEAEDTQQAYKRQSAEHERCLIRKGYRYIGHCSNDYMKSMPACGAP